MVHSGGPSSAPAVASCTAASHTAQSPPSISSVASPHRAPPLILPHHLPVSFCHAAPPLQAYCRPKPPSPLPHPCPPAATVPPPQPAATVPSRFRRRRRRQSKKKGTPVHPLACAPSARRRRAPGPLACDLRATLSLRSADVTIPHHVAPLRMPPLPHRSSAVSPRLGGPRRPTAPKGFAYFCRSVVDRVLAGSSDAGGPCVLFGGGIRVDASRGGLTDAFRDVPIESYKADAQTVSFTKERSSGHGMFGGFDDPRLHLLWSCRHPSMLLLSNQTLQQQWTVFHLHLDDYLLDIEYQPFGASALKLADIGVAMGITGTEVQG
ncbi:hypothetical protein U9M48_043510 [Paspalum notatum var. saurae]|uniref:Uncharacterized protein n=1 Tax=Paspalum notatum var. saurae TaxID=547442 RepID=A0AAQ3UXL7_PASNO